MVIWVFAGGGEAEVKGLITFLQKHFNNCSFVRKTPIRKKPPGKPNQQNLKKNKIDSYGKTGKSLVKQIERILQNSLKYESNQCELIFVLDDLDCRNIEQQTNKFLQSINEILSQFNLEDKIPILITFASPELESWIIADWDNSIAKHTDFRNRHQQMRWWLSSQCHIPFDNPESFSEYDVKKDSCQEKLSDYLIQSTEREDSSNLNQNRYSKQKHTSFLLLTIRPDIVKQKCPLFQTFYNYLVEFSQKNEIF